MTPHFAAVGLIAGLLILVILMTFRPGPNADRYVMDASPAEDAMAGSAS
jgi:hypothetical protein